MKWLGRPTTTPVQTRRQEILNEKKSIEINSKFKTNINGIFAIGDVVPGPMLAHKAEEEGVACVEFINGQKPHLNYDIIPAIVYTNPEVASVGKTESQLKEMKEWEKRAAAETNKP